MAGSVAGIPDLPGERAVYLDSKRRNERAAQGYWERFHAYPADSRIVLSLASIGAILSVLRSWWKAGQVAIDSYPSWMEEDRPELAGEVVSLVPTQLHRLLQSETGRRNLARSPLVFTGGAGLRKEEGRKALVAGIKLTPCYGATETAAMVVSHDPGGFETEKRGVGRPLPHAEIDLGPDGRLSVRSGSLARRIWPAGEWNPDFWKTADRGRRLPSGNLEILGRSDRVINSGGRKIDLYRIEESVRKLDGVEDVLALGLRDSKWGEALGLMVAGPGIDLGSIRQHLEQSFPAWMQPKHLAKTREIPRNQQGKPDLNRARGSLRFRS